MSEEDPGPSTTNHVIIDTTDSSDTEDESTTTGACKVCGQEKAQMHYGVLACVGCKGFFRRALKKADQLECLGSGNCTINKDARTSCRSCRLRRCLEVGMKPSAVRPDRDFTGRQRKTKKVAERKPDGPQSSERIQLQGDDWNKRLSVEMKTTLMKLLNIEARITKGDTNVDAQTLYPMKCLKTLKEILEDPGKLKGKRSEMRYERYKLCKNNELFYLAYRRLIAAIDWVEFLSELMTDKLSLNDKIALIKYCFTPLLVFEVAARTSLATEDPDVICTCNFGYIPRDMSTYSDSYHWGNGLVDRVLDELVTPYRSLKLKEEEIVCLLAIIVLNPMAKDISQDAFQMIVDLRNKIQDTLFAIMKESRPEKTACTQYGNLLLTLPTVMTMSNTMCENIQFAQTFSSHGNVPLITDLFGCFPVEPFEEETIAVQSLSISKKQYAESSTQTEKWMRAQKRRLPPAFTNPVEQEPRKKIEPPFTLSRPPCNYTIQEMFDDLEKEQAGTSSDNSNPLSPNNPTPSPHPISELLNVKQGEPSYPSFSQQQTVKSVQFAEPESSTNSSQFGTQFSTSTATSTVPSQNSTHSNHQISSKMQSTLQRMPSYDQVITNNGKYQVPSKMSAFYTPNVITSSPQTSSISSQPVADIPISTYYSHDPFAPMMEFNFLEPQILHNYIGSQTLQHNFAHKTVPTSIPYSMNAFHPQAISNQLRENSPEYQPQGFVPRQPVLRTQSFPIHAQQMQQGPSGVFPLQYSTPTGLIGFKGIDNQSSVISPNLYSSAVPTSSYPLYKQPNVHNHKQ